jgi:dynein heavy chain 1
MQDTCTLKKARDTESVIREVEAVSAAYVPLSEACSAIFFTIESLHRLHYLYHFSLSHFLSIFEAVLHANPALTGMQDPTRRLAVIFNSLFSFVYGTFL